ncbi:MAG TPA: TolC family protein [Phnomibacter sp.]|nr:TolC family protein [Phnomibacter sp.]
MKWLVGLLLIPAMGMAQNTAPKLLTLEQAVKLSLENNKQLRMDKARVEGALARVKQAEEKRLPELSASGTVMMLNNPTVSMKGGSSGGGGGTTPPTTAEKKFEVNPALIANVSASVPIYTGGQIKYGIQSAQFLAEATRLDATVNEQAVIQNSVQAYVNLYKASQAVRVVAENLADEQQRVKDFTNLESQGLLARNDLMKASLQASNVELALLEAKSNLQVASTNMNIMLGLPEYQSLVVDTTNFKIYENNKSLAEWEDIALTKRVEFASNKQRQKAADAQINSIKGSMLPSLSASGGYFTADVKDLMSITNAVNVGVGLKYNVSSLWKTKAKISEASAQKNELVAAGALLDDHIRMQLSKAYEDYLLSVRKIDVYNIAVEQAQENYRITNNKYKNDLATLTDLLDADLGRLRANLNKANANADVSVAYANLLQAAGILEQQIFK